MSTNVEPPVGYLVVNGIEGATPFEVDWPNEIAAYGGKVAIGTSRLGLQAGGGRDDQLLVTAPAPVAAATAVGLKIQHSEAADPAETLKISTFGKTAPTAWCLADPARRVAADRSGNLLLQPDGGKVDVGKKGLALDGDANTIAAGSATLAGGLTLSALADKSSGRLSLGADAYLMATTAGTFRFHEKGQDYTFGALSSGIRTSQQAIAKNAADIKTHQQAIAKNAADIKTDQQAIAKNAADIKTDQQAIAKNAADIKTSQQAIAQNVAAIHVNAAGLAGLASRVDAVKETAGNNEQGILANREAIASQHDDLEAIKETAAKNEQAIFANREAIAAHTAVCEANTDAIAQNKADIAASRAAITANQTAIAANAGGLTAAEGRLQVLETAPRLPDWLAFTAEKRMGVGVPAPAVPLEVAGTVRIDQGDLEIPEGRLTIGQTAIGENELKALLSLARNRLSFKVEKFEFTDASETAVALKMQIADAAPTGDIVFLFAAVGAEDPVLVATGTQGSIDTVIEIAKTRALVTAGQGNKPIALKAHACWTYTEAQARAWIAANAAISATAAILFLK